MPYAPVEICADIKASCCDTVVCQLKQVRFGTGFYMMHNEVGRLHPHLIASAAGDMPASCARSTYACTALTVLLLLP